MISTKGIYLQQTTLGGLMVIDRSFLHKTLRALCIIASVFCASTFPTSSFAYSASSAYDCGNGGDFPMRFGGCKPGYYYEDWQDADDSLGPDEVGECIECPYGYTCFGGFAGPVQGEACSTGYYGISGNCTACTNKPAHSTYIGGAATNDCPWACDSGYKKANGQCVEFVFDPYEDPYEYTSSGSMYDCGKGGVFPMYFGGCRPGYYYEDWQNPDYSLHPDEVGECLECPSGATCAGGFAGPSFGSPCDTGYYGSSLESCTACTNKPAHSTYSGSALTNECPWTCDTGYGESNGSCVACAANQFWVNGTCESPKFTLTTTNLSANDTFQFQMSATGTFYVDCGTDGTLSGTGVSGYTITRSDTNLDTYTCTYTSGGAKTIGFGGTATGYNTNTTTAAIRFNINNGDSDTNAQKVASISGNLATMFPYISGNAQNGAQPRFIRTFLGCTNLTSIPENLFSGYTTGASHMFMITFRNCTGLTSIPAGLFSGITTGAGYMFYSTFSSCTGLTSIPAGLFAGITTGANVMFFHTFRGCTGLTSIPAGLFANITTGAEGMFSATFSGCTNISGYIPPTTFAGLIANGSPTATNMWNSTFDNTQLATSCPAGTGQYITGYEGTDTSTYTKWNGKVSCGCQIGNYGVSADSCSACTNKPAHSTYTGNAVTNTCPWVCDTGYVTNGTACVEPTFSLTTTNLSANDTFEFNMSARGTFYVNWGDGTEETITRTDTTETTYSHTYTTAGAKTIGFGGTATGYNTATTTAAIRFNISNGDSDTNATKVASISGNLATMFPYLGSGSGQQPRFRSTFMGCTNLTSIPENLFSGYTTGASYMFGSTFSGCTGLTSIPAGLFSGYTTGATLMFRDTFSGCTGLTSIPAGLFSGITTGAEMMFSQTFENCTGLTSIPAGLFAGITTGAQGMFDGTFYRCTGLTSIPENLFSGITTGAAEMFNATFYGCFNLSGYIPPTTFAGLIANGSPTANNMWKNTFYNTQLVTSCPAGTSQYITGYEGTDTSYYTKWNGKVSCGCPYGTYGDGVTCSACTNSKPEHSSWAGGATTSTCAWKCDAGYVSNGTACVEPTFSLTTTNLSANDTFQFKLSAIGTFYVNWGDGFEQTITRTDTTETTYSHTYTTAGAYTVGFAGTATGYNTSTTTAAIRFNIVNATPDPNAQKVASISGNLATMFPYISGNSAGGAQPRFNYTFSGCRNLTSIPENLFAGYTTGAEGMFQNTFNACTGLTSIPAGLFAGITTGASHMFQNTFQGCTGLTSIPAGLFSGITTGADYMFYGTFASCTGLTSIPAGLFTGITTGTTNMFAGTFQNCTGLTSIPAGLFAGITTGANNMFWNTFYGCTNLTSIPAGLFAGITTGAQAMFGYTFYGCSNLSGYIPPTTFAGLIANGSPTAFQMWERIFIGTQLVTSCPAGTSQYITGYEGGNYMINWNGKVSCGCEVGYYGTSLELCTACSNKPENAVYIGSGVENACPWKCADGYVQDGTACVEPTFTLTTTNLSANDTFQFKMSAMGTFYVDCGTDGTLSGTGVSGNTITRTGTSEATYTCTYSTAGAKTIGFGGTATGYSTNTQTAAIRFNINANAAKVASISGNLATMFPYISGNTAGGAQPRFYDTFNGCTNLTSIPENLFAGYTTGAQSMFLSTFDGCTGLTSIPENLFAGITTGAQSMFWSTFDGCTGLTSIPENLFAGITTGAESMFYYTFSGCTGLTSIPAGLFAGITTGAGWMFQNTFSGCTGLTSIPENLFSGITTGAQQMFWGTFGGCTNISGYIPPTTFAGLIANGSPTATSMWSDTFTNTQLVTSCPAGTSQYITGYEGTDTNTTWNGKVSCVDTASVTVTYSCGDGTGTAPTATTATGNNQFTPSGLGGCANGNKMFIGWKVSGTNDIKPAGTAFTWNYSGDKTLTAQWVEPKFTLTTTNLSANDTFQFMMSAKGTFYVDCGTDGTLSGTGVSGNTITRTDTTEATYTCTYSTAGAKTIGFAGTATGYSTDINTAVIRFNISDSTPDTNAQKVASISGNLATMFPYLGSSYSQQPRFRYTFYGCTGLTSIPENLFAGITTGAPQMFWSTFSYCTGLTSIPAGLFSGITTGAYGMFASTFYGCTGLTSIPAGLFSGITTGAQAMFIGTFYGCTNLSGYIPPTTFAGLIANGSPNAFQMWERIFVFTQLVTSCPAGTSQYITGYEGSDYRTKWNGKVSCGCPYGTYGDGVTCSACTNSKPEHSSWAGGATTSTCAWKCDAGYVQAGDSCIETTFSLTTTNLSANDTFQFKMSATGTFGVNCGDGGTLSGTGVSGNTITRTDTTEATYTCTYSTAGAKTIGFTGTATGYNTNTQTAAIRFNISDNTPDTNAQKVASISGNLATMFPYISGNAQNGAQPRFYNTFNGCTGLTSIPENLFAGYTTGAQSMFSQTFSGCTGLTSIPAGLFSGITTGAQSMFAGTFQGCTGLTSIPAGLFSGITTRAAYMFSGTFRNCTGLTSISENLFAGITTGAQGMFNITFDGCTNLTSIPENLFAGITTGADSMFLGTFYGCSNLSGYIPPTTFAGLIANGSPTANMMWSTTFDNTQLVTSCPAGTSQYITGYEGSTYGTTWNGKVSCVDTASVTVTYSCGDGTGTAPTATTATGNNQFTPSELGGCTNGNKMFIGWKVSGTNDIKPAGTAFTWNYSGDKTLTAQWVEPKFTLTTKNLSAGDTFQFKLSAKGTFVVNCGDGGTLSGTGVSGNTITRTDTTEATYTCTYSTAGTKTIGFAGTATGYSTDINTAVIRFNVLNSTPDTNAQKVASISGNLATMFPYLGSSYSQQPRFRYTFYGCTGLTSIPENLFAGITTGAPQMFWGTFNGCTGLTSIPSTLFSGITTGADNMFTVTFRDCTGLTSIPAGLFSGITTGAQAMFFSTFYGCSNLSGYIPPTTFAGLIANGSPTASQMWERIFIGTQLVTSCPAGTSQYITGYEGSNYIFNWDGKVSCGCAAGTYGDGTTCSACANSKPEHSSWVGGATTSTCAWKCDAGYVTNGTTCVEPTFSLTTTNLSANYTFQFKMSAVGTFYVNWGDGFEQTITRTDTTETTYSHTYTTAGAYTVGFAGTATGYNTNTTTAAITFYNNSASAQKVASISGNLATMFPYLGSGSGQHPMFGSTFNGCTGLTSIPENLFAGYTTGASYMFYLTFNGCTGLTSIPENLFAGITTWADNMFYMTFMNCTGLTSIPENLFSGITTGAAYMFNSTFKNCTGLTSIPAGLFANITTEATNMFSGTFYGCTNISGYIPPTTFAGLIANGSPTATNMWNNTFNNTQLVTSCPAGTGQYITGYEGSGSTTWNGKVSCADSNQICQPGEYLPRNNNFCAECPENSYCMGGTFAFNTTADRGMTQCPNNWYSPVGMSSVDQCGRILNIGNNAVYLRSAKKTTPSLNVQIGNNVFYGNMTTRDVPMHSETERKLKLRFNDTTWSVYDDTVHVN